MLQRTVEQTLVESCVPRKRAQQRTAKQVDDFAKQLDALVREQSILLVKKTRLVA